MAKALVHVARIERRVVVIEVELPEGLTPGEQAEIAADLALDKAGDYNFYDVSAGTPEYEVEDVEVQDG